MGIVLQGQVLNASDARWIMESRETLNQDGYRVFDVELAGRGLAEQSISVKSEVSSV